MKYTLLKRSEVEPLPFNKDLYYIDDGSLIIVELNLDRTKVRIATTLIPPDQLKVVRTIGSDYLRHLSGQEAHDFLVEQNSTLAKNGLSNSTKSTERVGT